VSSLHVRTYPACGASLDIVSAPIANPAY
jgi:hypothetical protein